MVSKQAIKNKISQSRLKEFVKEGNFEIHTIGNEIMNVGLKWGETKQMKLRGFKQKEMVQMLDYLEGHPKLTKELFKELF